MWLQSRVEEAVQATKMKYEVRLLYTYLGHGGRWRWRRAAPWAAPGSGSHSHSAATPPPPAAADAPPPCQPTDDRRRRRRWEMEC
jgi:hypothetical protein